MTTPNRPWIQTFTGKRVSPLYMSKDDVCIEDIAHALALTNRFTGHTPRPYSVAQHSVLVSDLCPKEYKLWGLLHDAPEAYFADISRPVKLAVMEVAGPVLKKAERQIMDAVCERFMLTYEEPKEVKECDNIALANEAFSFFGRTENYQYWDYKFSNGYRDLGHRIIPCSWKRAENMFLEQYRYLTRRK